MDSFLELLWHTSCVFSVVCGGGMVSMQLREWFWHVAFILHLCYGGGMVVTYSLVEWWWHAGFVLRVQVNGWRGGGSGVVVAINFLSSGCR